MIALQVLVKQRMISLWMRVQVPPKKTLYLTLLGDGTISEWPGVTLDRCILVTKAKQRLAWCRSKSTFSLLEFVFAARASPQIASQSDGSEAPHFTLQFSNGEVASTGTSSFMVCDWVWSGCQESLYDLRSDILEASRILHVLTTASNGLRRMLSSPKCGNSSGSSSSGCGLSPPPRSPQKLLRSA